MAADPPDDATRGSASRWAIGLGTLVVLVVAFLLLRGGDDDNAATTQTGAAQSTTQQAQTSTTQEPQPTSTQDTSTTQTRTPAQKPSTTVIRVQDGEPVGGVKRLSVKKGERLRFVVRSTTTVPIHLHGYDVEKEAGPGKPAVFDLPADIEGRFEAEVESTGTQIARIDVTPS